MIPFKKCGDVKPQAGGDTSTADNTICWNSGSFRISKMYQLNMEDMKQIIKAAVLPNIFGPDSWEISYGNELAFLYEDPKWSP